ncbi:MAG: hypothetical protein JRG81_00050 [Deltaproteobacteria bacterium]|nr:hypothetical protein [Deltaproteobacteria bacterium]MBW2363469.1 hypothetical protein [Deltaproteobacteria bacterium]
MKRMSQAALKKKVEKKGLEVTRNKSSIKTKPKKPVIVQEKKPDLTSGVMLKSANVVIDMAQSLAVSADKMSESTATVAQIVQAIQEDLNKTPEPVTQLAPVAVGNPKKRKWRFTTIRDRYNYIKQIVVEEL